MRDEKKPFDPFEPGRPELERILADAVNAPTPDGYLSTARPIED